MDKQPEKCFVKETNCLKIYGAVPALISTSILRCKSVCKFDWTKSCKNTSVCIAIYKRQAWCFQIISCINNLQKKFVYETDFQKIYGAVVALIQSFTKLSTGKEMCKNKSVCIVVYVYQTTLVQHYILVDKQPAKRFVEDADCRKIYGAVAAQHCRLPLSSATA